MRFFTKVMQEIGLVGLSEPVASLFTQGMVLKGGAAMSKSRGNVVDPTEMCAQYGADTVRTYMLFAAPPEKDFDWSDSGIEGASRFLHRVYRGVEMHASRLRAVDSAECPAAPEQLTREERRLLRKTHQALRHVTQDMEERWHFNTDIAMSMDLVNELADQQAAINEGKIRPAALKRVLEYLVLILSLFAPHLADELWEGLGGSQPILRKPWPAYDPALAAEDELEIPVQVNGRLRGRIRVAADVGEEEIRKRAQAESKVAQYLNGRDVIKIIVVPRKLVNIVVK
jgi:leucyl-tRNA synthetase